MRDDLDRFYTKADVAQECLDRLDLSLYDLHIEPSAGSGAFSSLIPGSVAYDLAPAHPDVVEQDWLLLTPFELPEHDSLLVFGNPPFGQRSTIAKDFIRHAVHLGADTIAFILPTTFNKRTNQSVFPADWRLVDSMVLSNSHFDLHGHGEIYIPCQFYVWTRRADIAPGVDLREYPAPRPQEFQFVRRGSTDADFTVNGNSGKVKDLDQVTNPKSEHYIHVHDRDQVQAVRAVLETLDFTFHSSVNGGVAWINQDDIARSWHNRSHDETC